MIPLKFKNLWNQEGVADAHGYTKIRRGMHPEIYAAFAWMEALGHEVKGVVEFGHGVAPICYAHPSLLIHFPRKYVGAEINEQCISTCQQYEETFVDDPTRTSISFFNQNVIHDFSQEFEEATSDCDLVFMDTTLTLVQEPEKAMSNLIKRFDWILLKRHLPDNELVEKTKLKNYKWGGMTEPSTHWEFGKDFFDNLGCPTHIVPHHSLAYWEEPTSLLVLDCRND